MSKDKLIVEGFENIYERDSRNGAIISKDADSFSARILKKRHLQKENERISSLESQVEQINININKILSILESKNTEC